MLVEQLSVLASIKLWGVDSFFAVGFVGEMNYALHEIRSRK